MKSRRFSLFAPATFAVALSMSAQAVPFAWDPGFTPLTPSGGTATWNLANANWSNGTTDGAWTDTTGTNDTATFGGTAGTVTLGSNLGALGLVFATTGYTLSGASTLTLGTGGIDASTLTSGTTTIGHAVALAGGQSWNVGSGSNLGVSGIISGAGPLAKTGAGTLTLSGLNTFTGGLTISQGSLSIASNTALGGAAGTAGAVTINGGTLVTTGAGATITNTHAITIGASGGAMTINNGQNFFNTANTLLGTGTLTVNGGGTLLASTGNLRIAQTNIFSGNVVLQNGGNFEFGVANAIANTGSITINNQGEMIVNNGVTMANAITVAGGTNSVISFENGNTGTYSGTVTLNANAVIGLRDWYNYATVRGGTISGKVTGTGGITVNSGSGNGGFLTLSNATNDYSGGTTISASRVFANSIGSGAISISGTNAQLQMGSGTNFSNALTINGGGFLAQAALFAASGTATYSGTINITAAVSAGGHFASADNASRLIIAGDNTITTSAGVPVTVRLGNVIYSGAQSYTTGTSLSGGLLQFSKIVSMPASGTVAAATGSTVAVNVGGTGEFTDGTGTSTAGTIGGLLNGIGGQGAAVTFATGSSLGIDTTNAAGEVTYGTAFAATNSPGLIKLGTGTFTLTNGGTFVGGGAAGFPLVVRGGTLRLNGGTYAVTGEAVVGDNVAAGNAGTNAAMVMDAGTLTASGFFSVARGNGTGSVSSDLTLNGSSQISSAGFGIGYNNNNGANLPKGTVTLNGTSKITDTANSNAFNIAESAGSVGTITMNDSSTIQHNGAAAITRVGIAGKGLLNINSATATFNGRALIFGTTGGGTGALYNKGILTLSQGIFIGDNGGGGGTASGYMRNDNSGAAASSVPQLNVGASSAAASTSHAVYDNISGTLGNISGGIGINNSGGSAGTQNAQLNVFGGTMTTATTTFAGGGSSANKYGVINVMGASSLYTNTGAVNLGSVAAATNTGILTVTSGGTFTADTITASATANSYINLDNGTIRAQVGTTTSLVNSAVDGITVYSGGGIFDTGAFNKSVDAVIGGPTGNGVTSVSVSGTGTGYVGRPVVKITDATGTGATGYANFDSVTGQVTGVTITSAGSGYTAPTISILGGGGTAVTATATLGSVAGGGITKTGTGTLTLNAANTYSGSTQVTGGVLKAGVASVANVSGAFGKNSAVVLSNTTGVGVDITGFNTQIGSLAGGGASGGNVTLGAATLTSGADNTSTSFAGVISGTGGFTKTGSGTQILTGINTYTGATSVTAGKLVVNGSLANTTTTISTGATLGGSGTIGGSTTIQSGGHLAPGNSPGVVTFTNGLALAAGSNLDWELNANTTSGPGTAFDQVVVSGGTLTLSGTAVLNLSLGGTVDFTNSFWDSNQQWTVVSLTGSGTDGTTGATFTLGTVTGGLGDYNTEGAFSVSNLGGSQVLSWAAVPEPATAMLGALGMLALLRRRRVA